MILSLQKIFRCAYCKGAINVMRMQAWCSQLVFSFGGVTLPQYCRYLHHDFPLLGMR